jgi:hypothetical protein
MTARDWLEWIPTIITVLMAVGVFVGRNWLKARIERSVQHTFDQKMENIRADLRASEERLKSELRTKEAEISALRDGILSGRSQRQAVLDRRRLEAVERIWTRVSTGLGAYKSVATMMGSVNFDAVAKTTPTDARLRQVFAAFLAHIPEDDIKTGNMTSEKIFLSAPAWAYFSAYQTVLYVAYARAKVLGLGIDDPARVLNLNPLREVLKAALPHRSEYIDGQSISSYHYLLDELEENILKQLGIILEGREYDQAEISRAVEITTQVNKANTAIERANVATAQE